MFGLFKKPTAEELASAEIFSSLVMDVPAVSRHSYRKNGVYEVIFEDVSLDIPENQAKFNVLAHAWILIFGNDSAQLHVGTSSRPGYRLEIDSGRLYIGHKFSDHDELLDDLLACAGLSR